MRPGGGKAKGAAYERYVCKRLSLWVSDGARDDLFWRSSMSGGRATIGLRAGKARGAQAGDVSAVGRDPRAGAFIDTFYVECKHLRSVEIRDFVTGTKGGIVSIVTLAIEQAAEYRRKAMVIARQNRFPDFVFVEDEGATILQLATKGGLQPRALFPQAKVSLFLFNDLLNRTLLRWPSC